MDPDVGVSKIFPSLPRGLQANSVAASTRNVTALFIDDSLTLLLLVRTITVIPTVQLKRPENAVQNQKDPKNNSVMIGDAAESVGSKNNGCTDHDVQYNHYCSENLGYKLRG